MLQILFDTRWWFSGLALPIAVGITTGILTGIYTGFLVGRILGFSQNMSRAYDRAYSLVDVCRRALGTDDRREVELMVGMLFFDISRAMIQDLRQVTAGQMLTRISINRQKAIIRLWDDAQLAIQKGIPPDQFGIALEYEVPRLHRITLLCLKTIQPNWGVLLLGRFWPVKKIDL